MSYQWGVITSGATFHELVSNLLLHEYPGTHVFNREGPDGAIDALSADRTTVYQSKHHKEGTAANARADARRELAKIQSYRQPGHKWQSIWSTVKTWTLVTNVAFGTDDDQKWQNEIVAEFAREGLHAEYKILPHLEKMLADHPAVADAFFGQRPRLFVSLSEHREALAAREVLERAYDIPLYGRDADLHAIADFVRNSEHQILLVHGPGGVGKSRLLIEAASALVGDGTVSTVYCGTAHLATSDNWYIGIVPEVRALVLVDEPSDARFVERFLAELRTRAKLWRVLISVRTPRDPIIRVLTDPREKLLASPLEIGPLVANDASAFAQALLAPLALATDEKDRAARWLRDVCGRVPIWMTVAVKLLEHRRDLRDLPKDEFEIAQRYIYDIVENTRADVASAHEVLQLLRWISLAQPVNRHSEHEVNTLAETIEMDVGVVQSAIEDMVRRRVLTAFGIDRRMVEVRPDVVRDHVLVAWLTVADEGRRRPSIEAGTLARALASTSSMSRLAERVVGTLWRVENVANPTVHLLDPIADAAVQLAEAATNAAEQKQAIEFAATIASARPRQLARVATAIRTHVVPDVQDDSMFIRLSYTRPKMLALLPWQLFIAAHTASSSDERRAILDELVALIDLQAQLQPNERRFSDGKAARELLPRIIGERRGFRTSFHGESAAMATAALDELAQLEEPRPSINVLLESLLSIGRHESYSDEADPSLFHYQVVAVVPAGVLGRIATSIRQRLWEIVEIVRPWSKSRSLCWALLERFHSELNRHREDPAWNALLMDDLRRVHAVALSSTTALADLQAARTLWRWYVMYDEPSDRKQLASDCEAAYLQRPIISRFAAILGDQMGDTIFEAARDFDAPDRPTLDRFLTDALQFVSTHPDEWRTRRLDSFAYELGQLHAAKVASYREFVAEHLRADKRDPLRGVALAMAAGYISALRAGGDPDLVEQILEQLAMCMHDRAGITELIAQLFVNINPVAARRLGEADYTFLTSHWDAFMTLASWPRLLVLGRLCGTRNVALDRAIEQIVESDSEADSDTEPDPIEAVWHGFFETLPYPLSTEEIPSIVGRLIDVIAMRPDSRGPRGNTEWEIGETLKRIPRRPLTYLVDLVRRRLAAYGGNNRDPVDPSRRWVHALPDAESFIFKHVELIGDAEPSASARQAVIDLLALEHEDRTIEHDLPEVLVRIDPHGRLVPNLIAERLSDPLRTPTADAVAERARFAGWYAVGSDAWRKIAAAAAARLVEFEGDDQARNRVYSSLMSHRHEGWSGEYGKLHPRWQDAVDSARAKLDGEHDEGLRGFWQWCVEIAERRVEVERGRLEEREL
jgi:hypothetical protein